MAEGSAGQHAENGHGSVGIAFAAEQPVPAQERVRASDINEEMKMAAAGALAALITPEELSADYIIPRAFDPRVGPAVAKAVAEAARRTGVARL